MPGALTCARQSVVTAARSTWMPRCSSGRSGRPAARVRPTCTVSPPARRPAATRQRPARPASVPIRPREGRHRRPSAARRGSRSPPRGPAAGAGPAPQRTAAASICPRHPPAGGSQRPTAPPAARSAPLSAQGRISHGLTRPHGPLSAQRPTMRCDTPSAPVHPSAAAVGVVCERAVCRQSRIAQGPPAPHPAPPVSSHPPPARAKHLPRSPAGPICEIGGTPMLGCTLEPKSASSRTAGVGDLLNAISIRG